MSARKRAGVDGDPVRRPSEEADAPNRRQNGPEKAAVGQAITDTLEVNFMPYAMSVIVSRAIPEIDGFKPSHRKLLFTMYKMGLLGGARTKSANVVGQTMKLNPHGDQAIYETMVRLTRGNMALLHPYIDSKGNFGRQYSRDMQYAAARYTEVRLDRICEELFAGLDKDGVDFTDNYDGTMREPTLLPATFPSVLVNSNQGIAVGMASNICSFNLAEVCQATVAFIRDPADDLLDLLPAPDFASGGEIIHNIDEIYSIYESGRGSIRLRARYRVDRKNGFIEVYEIPYSTTVETIIDDIADAVKSGKIKDISDVRDETDLDGLKITLDYRRSADPDAIMQKLFHLTSLQSTFPCNFNILIGGSPRVLGIRGIIAEWLAWRRSCLRREIAFDMEKRQERLHLLRGLEKILLDIDKAIRIIRATEKESEVVPNLMAGFDLDEAQADYVADIRLRHLNRQVILQRTAEIKSLLAEIKKLRDLLENRELLDQRIIEQLQEVERKYGQPRRSVIVREATIDVPDASDWIEDYRLKLFLTAHGYLKKLPLTSLRSAGELRTKEDDTIVQELEGKNKADLLLFSDQGIVYKLRCHDLRDHKPSEFGEYTPNLLDLAPGERIVFMQITEDYSGQLMIGFANGKFVRFEMATYITKNNRRKLLNAYSTVSLPVSFSYIAEQAADEPYVAYSSSGRALVFNASQVPLKSTRSSQGVQILLSRKNSVLSACHRLAETELGDGKAYRTRTLPAVGTAIRERSLQARQPALDDLPREP